MSSIREPLVPGSKRRLLVALTVPQSLALYGRILSRLVERGWDVHVVTGERVPESVRCRGVTYHTVPLRRAVTLLADVSAIVAMVAVLRSAQPQVILAGTPKASFVACIAGRLMHVPHRIFHVWGCRWDRGRGLRKHLLRAADWLTASCATQVIPVSRSLGELLLAHGIGGKRSLMLGDGGTKGVDIRRFCPSDRGSDACDSHVPIVGYLGRLAEDKGISWLPQVISQVLREIPTARFLVIGSHDSADAPPTQTVLELERHPSVEMTGALPDPVSQIQRMHVLCFPSLREGLPNAVIEAAACEVPAVGWDATGTRDAILNGVTGSLVPYGDVDSMSSAIVRILRDHAARKRLGHAARTYVAERWESGRVEDLMLLHLTSLVSEPASVASGSDSGAA